MVYSKNTSRKQDFSILEEILKNHYNFLTTVSYRWDKKMASVPETIKISLRAIGLTDYEISIYLTLIAKGPMDARELSEASGVPYSRIYNILTQLEKDKMWIINYLNYLLALRRRYLAQPDFAALRVALISSGW